MKYSYIIQKYYQCALLNTLHNQFLINWDPSNKIYILIHLQLKIISHLLLKLLGVYNSHNFLYIKDTLFSIQYMLFFHFLLINFYILNQVIQIYINFFEKSQLKNFYCHLQNLLKVVFLLKMESFLDAIKNNYYLIKKIHIYQHPHKPLLNKNNHQKISHHLFPYLKDKIQVILPNLYESIIYHSYNQ